MNKKLQIIIIHGGTTFKSNKDYLKFLRKRRISIEKKIRWTDDYLDNKLGRDIDIIRLAMPLKENAKYKEWKIHFERHFPYFKSNSILIGFSLGGIFLAKYLSENKFPKKILSIYIICAPFDNTIPGEDLVGGFKLKSDLCMLEESSKNLYLLFSEDDNVVPISHAEKYARKLKNAKIIIYESKNGHFKVQEFPELIQIIKNDIKRK
ncbi:MAG: alpha/beta hydrolase [Nanoarchaeota archaeon]|nr:alpha/beta hydrolase [Nanoarchaeota archaeon]